MEEYAGHQTVLVADVDCTAGGKALCDEVGVRGYPTIKYGDPSDLQEYNGGRDLAGLKKFASELKPMCSPANVDLCDEEKKAQIKEFEAMGPEAREAKIAELTAQADKIEADFKTFVEGLQKEYSEATKKKDADLEPVKASVPLLKAVHKLATKAKEEL